MPDSPSPTFTPHYSGRALLEAKLAAIEQARSFIRMETFIYRDEAIGRRFKAALLAATQRGVWVRLLVDAVGSLGLPRDYFQSLASQPKATMRWFNEPSLGTWSFRDHRKLLVIDGQHTFLGGCNIGEEYAGDGITTGWRDGGLHIHHAPLATEMEQEFDHQFEHAEFKQWHVQVEQSLRTVGKRKQTAGALKAAGLQPLFIRPGFGQSALRDAVRHDLKGAKRVCITSAYFLPSRGLRRQLGAAVARGADMRLLLGGKNDVPMMQLATRSLYPKLLDAGLRIFEYTPQILHAKGLIIDDVVYVGSSNLDPRSLRINFEIMLRIESTALAATLREQFDRDLQHSEEVTEGRHATAGLITRFKQSASRWLLGRVDPRMSEGMLRRLQMPSSM